MSDEAILAAGRKLRIAVYELRVLLSGPNEVHPEADAAAQERAWVATQEWDRIAGPDPEFAKRFVFVQELTKE